MSESIPRVVILGGGFGGLAAAKVLKRAKATVILIDRTNHHVFQPLLYQVATSVLTAGQIGSPIRGIIGRNSNTTVILGEVTGVDKDKRCVFVSSVDRRYAGLAIYRRVARFSAPEPFRYFDKGNLAVVGKGFAVLQSG
jgi:NADH dehydrogenase